MAYSYLYPAFVLIIDVLLGHGLPKPAVLPGVLIVRKRKLNPTPCISQSQICQAEIVRQQYPIIIF